MGEPGEMGVGIVKAPPYIYGNARAQLFYFLELVFNYRLFEGIPDPVLSPRGFGDFADRGANAKIALVTPELSSYELPGIAVGVEDFMGSKKLTSNARSRNICVATR